MAKIILYFGSFTSSSQRKSSASDEDEWSSYNTGKLLIQNDVRYSTDLQKAELSCDRYGSYLGFVEDVGRHNALDKLIGSMLMENKIPLTENILLLSGRASFELIQKSVMAGINLVVAIGATSSLAVELAKEFNVTLVGFLKHEWFNIYSHEERVEL